MKLPATIRLLIIEDEDAVLRGLATFFSDSGYEVLTAPDGIVGMELFCQERPDLVFTDLRMPNMGGLEVIKAIRDLSPDTPVIVISGTGLPKDALEALSSAPGAALITRAAGGTLFLEGIGALEEASQVGLLRLLRDGEYLPRGCDYPHLSDARLVLCTGRNLAEMVAQKTFLKDLFVRLSAIRSCFPRSGSAPRTSPFCWISSLTPRSSSLSWPRRPPRRNWPPCCSPIVSPELAAN